MLLAHNFWVCVLVALNPLMRAVQESIDFIKNRHHPEKPHISVLSPPHPKDYSLIWRDLRLKRTYDEVEEDEDEVIEDLEELLRARAPGWIFGSDFKMREDEEPWAAEVSFGFYVRVKPDFDEERMWDESAYARAFISLKYWSGSRNLVGELLLESGGGGEAERKSISASSSAEFIAILVAPQEAVRRLNRDGLKEVLRRVASIGLGGSAPNVELKPVFISSNLLSAEVYDRKGSQVGAYYHAFCVLLGHSGSLFKVYLINLGGALESNEIKLVRESFERPFSVYTYNSKDNYSRWALGFFFEVEARIKFSGRSPGVSWSGYGLSGAYPINALVQEGEESGEFILKDYCVAAEGLPLIRKSERASSSFLASLAQKISGGLQLRELNAFMHALSQALKDAANISAFYTYQERAIEAVLASLGIADGPKRKSIVIMARTAGGKTYAFLVPILISIFASRARDGKKGVKAILMYPTKALANDQAEELAHLLFYLRERLKETNLNFGISFGCLHGGTYDIEEVARRAGSGETLYLPTKCPVHNEPVRAEVDGGKVLARCPSGESCPFASFLNEWMKKVREEVYFDPPDILITDEDMINRIISGASKAHRGRRGDAPWYEWQLLGYPYMRCGSCLHTYPPSIGGRKCKVCGEDLGRCAEPISNLSKPEVIVLDEAHQIYGSFGIQVHHMLSLLERVLGYKPLYVLSSATLGDASRFASTLLDLSDNEVEVIEAEVEAGLEEQRFQRIFTLVMPKAYTKDATAVRLLSRFYGKLNYLSKRNPKGIIFTNTLSENSELLQHIRNEFAGSIKVDGHSTDFEGERAQKELEFKGGRIDLFVATSTLELGIDYGTVDFVAIYGVPAKVSSFVQRIGRAGRNRDAAVFVIFDPDSPMNYSYYENYRILCDGALRNEAMAHEVILISPMNEEAVRRAVKRWAVSEVYRACANNKLLCKVLVDDLKNVDERISSWTQISEHITSAASSGARLPKSLWNLYNNFLMYRNIIDGEVRRISSLLNAKSSSLSGISSLIRELGEDSLYNLRAADEEVRIIYSPLNVRDRERLREMRYAVKHCLPGQVTSYRGFFFVAYTGERREVPIKQWFGD